MVDPQGKGYVDHFRDVMYLIGAACFMIGALVAFVGR